MGTSLASAGRTVLNRIQDNSRRIVMVGEKLLPKGDLTVTARSSATEFDVKKAIEVLGREVWPIGVFDDLPLLEHDRCIQTAHCV